MAVISPAIGIQEGSHTAQSFRQLISALTGQDVETFAGGVGASGPAHGLGAAGHLEVTEKSGTPDMSVDVASGLALITGTSSLAQGPYAFCNDATVNLAIATADSTNDRHDLIVAQVRDNDEDGGGQNDARLAVVTGTPAGSPSDPAVPAGCLVLARVVVGANASSIVDGDITNLATVAKGTGGRANVRLGNVKKIQAGVQSASTGSNGLLASISFPEAFGSTPAVTASVVTSATTQQDTVNINAVNASAVQFRLMRNGANAGSSVAAVVHWIAIEYG